MRPGRAGPGRAMAKPLLIALGGLTGFGSAMSGTGGPLILLPILLWLYVPVISAIGVAQAVQLPIALLATGGNFLSGEVAVLIGLVIAKMAATAISIGCGFAGGVFSPSLFIGAMVGGAFGIIAGSVFPDYASSPSAYSIIGMGAVAAAVLGFNFPGSEWYLDSYALLEGVDLRPAEDKGSWISQAFDSIF